MSWRVNALTTKPLRQDFVIGKVVAMLELFGVALADA